MADRMGFRYLDVCSGYSAASIAFEPLGWTCVGYAENEPAPSAVLAARRGAGRPIHMPDPAEAGDEAERRRRANAIKALDRFDWGDRVRNFGDFTKIQEDDFDEPIDLLVGGTPCQDFSVAGRRVGLDGPRGLLTIEYLRLAQRLRPRRILWENVPGVLSIDGGRAFGAFLGALGQLGYRWAYRVLDAQFTRVAGFPRAVPQRRKRVFVVGYLGDGPNPGAVLFDPQSMRGDPAPRRSSAEGAIITQSLTTGFGSSGPDYPDAEAGWLVADVGHALTTAAERNDPSSEDFVVETVFLGNAEGGADDVPFLTASNIAKTVNNQTPLIGLNAHQDPCPADVAGALKSARCQEQAVAFKPSYFTRGKDGATSEGAPPLTADTDKGDQDTVLLVPEGPVAFTSKDGGGDAGEVSPTLRAMGHTESHANGGGQVAVAIPILEPGSRTGKSTSDVRAGLGVGEDGDPMFTLQADRQHAVCEGTERWAVRRLTPVECERLQGAPDDFTLIFEKSGKPLSDSARYRMIGNSMAANVMRWIGEGIVEVDRLCEG